MQNDDECMLARIRQLHNQVNSQSEFKSEVAAILRSDHVDMEYSSAQAITGPSHVLDGGVIGGELGVMNSASALNHGQLLDEGAALMHLLYGHVMQHLAGSTPPLISSSTSSSPITPPIYTNHPSIFTDPLQFRGSAATTNIPMDDYNNTVQLISSINANYSASCCRSSTASAAASVMNLPSPLTRSYSSTTSESLTVLQPSTHVASELMVGDQQQVILWPRDHAASSNASNHRHSEESAFHRWIGRDQMLISTNTAGDHYRGINAGRGCSYGRGSLLKRCLREVVPWMGMHMMMMQPGMGDMAAAMMGSPRSFSSASDPQHPTNLSSGHFVATAQQQEEAARQHMMAERTRRRKLNELFKTLKSLIPPIHQPKRDKVSILESAIFYMRQLQDLIQDLQQKARTPVIAREGATPSKMGSNVCGNNSIDDSRDNLQAQYQRSIIVSGIADSNPPLFKLELDVTLPSVDQVNITMVHVHNILQSLKLRCVTSNTNFDFATGQLKASIYAQHENDVESTLPNPKDIEAEFLEHL